MQHQRFQMLDQATADAVGNSFRFGRRSGRVENPDRMIEWYGFKIYPEVFKMQNVIPGREAVWTRF
ncbi:hypothetical protein D3C87_1893050 [compost metagenome]